MSHMADPSQDKECGGVFVDIPSRFARPIKSTVNLA